MFVVFECGRMWLFFRVGYNSKSAKGKEVEVGLTKQNQDDEKGIDIYI